MKWFGYFLYSMSLIVLLTGISQWLPFTHGAVPTKEWVVRFDDDLDLHAISWPQHVRVISFHSPVHCVVIQSDLAQDEIQSLIGNIDTSAYLSPARKDVAGSPVYPTGSVLLALEPTVNQDQVAAWLQRDIEQYFEQLHWIRLRIPLNETYDQFKARCLQTAGIKNVFPDEIILCESHQTNDPLYSTSWHISQTSDKDIDADEGWMLLPAGASSKSITLIEGVGFDTLNADLSGRFIDTYNATNQTTNVYANTTVDKHGTAVAGIPGAICDNAISAAGLGKNKLWLQVIRIGYNTTTSGTFTTSSSFQAAAINRAMALNTTSVISMSFGSSTYQAATHSAIQSALTQGRSNKGIPVFGSSGNAGLNSWTNYPASYTGVIAVGATTSQDLRSTTSNYGPALTLSAPGASIATTDISGPNGYSAGDNTYFSGTSAAAPVAASIGALMIVANPNVTANQVKQYLAQSCEKVGGYTYSNNTTQNLSTWSNELGYGRVNMRAAIQLCLPQNNALPDVTLSNGSVSNTAPAVGSAVTIQVTQNISGLISAVSPSIEYRYSADALWSADDIVIGTDQSAFTSGVLSELENITYTIPNTTGTMYILISADFPNAVNEANENNNLIALPITVSAASSLPDIFITNASVSAATATVGQIITINATQNRSPIGTASSYPSLQYRLSPDAIWESTDTYIGSDVSTFTATIGSEAENITYTIPNTPGNRYVLIRCDASNVIVESNENNNVVAIPITIVAAAAQQPFYHPTREVNEAKLTLYPNPAHERLYISVDKTTITSAFIIDASGQLCRSVYNEEVENGIDISTLEQGVYVLRILADNAISNHRFIKQ